MEPTLENIDRAIIFTKKFLEVNSPFIAEGTGLTSEDLAASLVAVVSDILNGKI